MDYDCDCGNRLKMSAAMRYMQQASGAQLDALGLPYGKLLGEGMIFLLSKSCIRVFEMPVSGQNILVGTAPVATKGARFVREFTVEDRRGNRMISALTLWLLVDPENRRILRPASFPYDLPYEDSLIQNEIGDVAVPKLPDSGDSVCREIPVLYSHIDCNNHVNNSVYADFVCDCLPVERLLKRGLDTLVINFQNEARLGETIGLRVKALSEREFHISGSKGDGAACFESLAVFKEFALDKRA